MKNKTFIWGILGVAMLGHASLAQPVVTLESYLLEAKMHHGGIIGSSLIRGGVRQTEIQTRLLTGMNFYATGQAMSDAKVSVFSALSGSKTDSITTAAGLSWQTDSGLQTKLEYRLGYYQLPNASGSFGGFSIPSTYYDSGPSLQMTLPLWRNAGGSELKVKKAIIAANIDVKAVSESLSLSQILFEAENSYWRLLVSKAILDVEKKSFERAQQLNNWMENRVKLQLADQSDAFQTSAALKLRELDYQSAQAEDMSAERAFDLNRGVTNLVQYRNLPSLDDMFSDTFAEKLPSYNFKEDVQLFLAQAALTSANIVAEIEKTRPTLDLNAGVALNQWDYTLQNAGFNAFSVRYPTYYVGFGFNMPLDSVALNGTVAGLSREKEGLVLLAERKKMESRSEWVDLNEKLNAAKDRLKIAVKVEAIQKSKLENEKVRHQRGRSTVYQVLVFEQDYDNAQLSKIRAKAEILQLMAKLKTFRR